MEEIIAGLAGVTFAFEQDVELQKGTGLLPFQGMDKSNSAVCNFFAKGLCEKGNCSNKDCYFLHVKPAPKPQDCPWYGQGFCKDGCQPAQGSNDASFFQQKAPSQAKPVVLHRKKWD